jgi:hypothetical protein
VLGVTNHVRTISVQISYSSEDRWMKWGCYFTGAYLFIWGTFETWVYLAMPYQISSAPKEVGFYLQCNSKEFKKLPVLMVWLRSLSGLEIICSVFRTSAFTRSCIRTVNSRISVHSVEFQLAFSKLAPWWKRFAFLWNTGVQYCTVFTKAHLVSVLWARWCQTTMSHRIHLRSIIILVSPMLRSYELSLCFRFPRQNTICLFLRPLHATCPARLIFLDLSPQ